MVAKLQEKARRIRMVILDVDGVLSDGTINVSGSGELYKAFFVRDGLGIKMLQKAGIPVGIITGRSSDIVARRAEELGITDLAQGQRFKTNAWEVMLARHGLETFRFSCGRAFPRPPPTASPTSTASSTSARISRAAAAPCANLPNSFSAPRTAGTI